jgi:hypothetical protein
VSLNRYAKQRDLNEPEIIAALRTVGVSVEVVDTPCDLICGHRGKTYLLEVKGEVGRLTPAQMLFIGRFKGKLHIVHSPEEAVEAIFGKSAIVSRGCR